MKDKLARAKAEDALNAVDYLNDDVNEIEKDLRRIKDYLENDEGRIARRNQKYDNLSSRLAVIEQALAKLNSIEIKHCPKCDHKTLMHKSEWDNYKLGIRAMHLTGSEIIWTCGVCGQAFTEVTGTKLEARNETNRLNQ